MQMNDYREAVLNYFGVSNTNDLKANPKFQKLTGDETLNFRSIKSWQLIYDKAIASNSSYKDKLSAQTHSDALPSNNDSIGNLIELKDAEQETVGVLLQYNKQESQRLIDRFRNLSLHSQQNWHDGTLSSSIADQLGSSSSVIASGLEAGQVFRAVGPPDLIKGIAKGTHKMLQSSTGLLGSVKKVGGSKIVGNLRFAPASMVSILSPVVAYQILHTIASTHQLAQINQRLDRIQRTLEMLHVRQDATVMGEIHYALNVLDDIIEERMQTGKFTEDMSFRLALVEKSVLSLLERNRILIEYFRQKAQGIKETEKQQPPRHKAHNMADLLHEEGSQAIHDMQCLVGLIVSDLKVEQARLLLAMQNNPADVGRRQDRIRTKMEGYSKAISDLLSVEELKDYAFECRKAMSWWSQNIFSRGTVKKVEQLKNLDIKDVEFQTDSLKTGLSGYVFWKDDQGTHVLAVSGEDLKLQLDLTIDRLLKAGQETQIRLPNTQDILQVHIKEEIEPKIWRGVTNTHGIDEEVIIRYRKK